MQLPPRYSAIKLQGQPAYKRARAGEEITLEARPITIYDLQITAWQSGSVPRLTLAIECSKGTYIRSLAYDLGEHLGYGAHLSSLLRTRSGPFSLAESVTLEQLALASAQSTLAEYLMPADQVLRDYPALYLDDATAARVRHGNPFQYEGPPTQPFLDLARIYDTTGCFIAIAAWDNDQHLWHPKKVFTEP
jgi:tRNA pseudouridine55 synthase